MPEDFSGGWLRKSGEHSQERGLSRAGRSQESHNHAGLDRQAGGRDYLDLSAVRPVKFLLDLAGFDDRFDGLGQAPGFPCFGWNATVSIKLVNDLPPRHFRKL